MTPNPKTPKLVLINGQHEQLWTAEEWEKYLPNYDNEPNHIIWLPVSKAAYEVLESLSSAYHEAQCTNQNDNVKP